jgi:ribosome-associated protein
VNKVSTAVQLRFDLGKCTALDPLVKRRLQRLGGKRVTAGGILLIQADAHRTQLENRRQAILELKDILARALLAPRRRIQTRPTRAAREERLRSKKQRSHLKRTRSGADLE